MKIAESNKKLVEASEKAGRDYKAYILFIVIIEETDKAAEAKWKGYKDRANINALA